MTSPVASSSIAAAMTTATTTATTPDSHNSDGGVRSLVEEVDALLKIKSSNDRDTPNAHLSESKF